MQNVLVNDVLNVDNDLLLIVSLSVLFKTLWQLNW